MSEKIAQCCDCLTTFNRSRLIERYIEQHNGVAEWSCPVCKHYFELPGNGEHWTQREREEDDVYYKI